jgi:hypothetical protein
MPLTCMDQSLTKRQLINWLEKTLKDDTEVVIPWINEYGHHLYRTPIPQTKAHVGEKMKVKIAIVL